jgi:hypothetical protein
MQCLDYFMEILKKTSVEPKKYRLRESTVDVEKFLVDHKEFTQLSDHYALKGVVIPNKIKESFSF